MSDCVFCDIATGRSPASIVYQDETALAFMDIYPIHPGHTLVIPRVHIQDLAQCPLELAGQLFIASSRVAPAVVAATDAAGFNVWTANGKEAGQEVFHLHLHILPRFVGDTFGLRFPKGYPAAAPRSELEEMAAHIRQAAQR
ncbi:MAG: HIT family protein [Gemmatimonadota bacterium]|nr:MAG: HIT family protein [Gemmatimonadota bacterium]